jgi:hypothetical protein
VKIRLVVFSFPREWWKRDWRICIDSGWRTVAQLHKNGWWEMGRYYGKWFRVLGSIPK